MEEGGNHNIEFMDMDNWKGDGNKFGLTYKQICMEHINRCVRNGSEEWRGGYWDEKVAHNGNIVRKYNPDTREAYNNSIKMLRAVLLCKYDPVMKTKDADIIQKIKAYDGKSTTPQDALVKINLHIELFEELVMLIERLNFFEEYEETISL